MGSKQDYVQVRVIAGFSDDGTNIIPETKEFVNYFCARKGETLTFSVQLSENEYKIIEVRFENGALV